MLINLIFLRRGKSLAFFFQLISPDAFYDRHWHYPGRHDQELALEVMLINMMRVEDEAHGWYGHVRLSLPASSKGGTARDDWRGGPLCVNLLYFFFDIF